MDAATRNTGQRFPNGRYEFNVVWFPFSRWSFFFIYSANLMSKCWKEDPKDRPNFKDLSGMVHEILGCEEVATQVYV